MQDVHIFTCLTAYTDGYGTTCILVFYEVILFGTSMDHSLIFENQIQMTLMPVSSDLFDENWNLVIDQKKVFIPFRNYGTTVYFDSRVPNQREITECTHIIIMGETEWGHQ